MWMFLRRGDILKKYIITGIIIVFILLLLIVVALILKNRLYYIKNKDMIKLKNKKIEHDKLIEIHYSCSGDMNGNVDRISLSLDGDNYKLVSILLE